MPKKATSARSRAQRNKPKAQKSFELVRPEKVVPETEESSVTTSASTSTVDERGQAQPLREEVKAREQGKPLREEAQVAEKGSEVDGWEQTSTLREDSKPLREESQAVRRVSKAGGRGQVSTLGEEQEAKTQESQSFSAPKSASARLAARRQAAQKLQQRSAVTLITSEHFAYVRKDLIRIAVFAGIMITAIIVLYFMLGRA